MCLRRRMLRRSGRGTSFRFVILVTGYPLVRHPGESRDPVLVFCPSPFAFFSSPQRNSHTSSSQRKLGSILILLCLFLRHGVWLHSPSATLSQGFVPLGGGRVTSLC